MIEVRDLEPGRAVRWDGDWWLIDRRSVRSSDSDRATVELVLIRSGSPEDPRLPIGPL